jgi:hypothetical protein
MGAVHAAPSEGEVSNLKSKVLVLTTAAVAALGSAAATSGASSAVTRIHANLKSTQTKGVGTFRGVIRTRKRRLLLQWSISYRRVRSTVLRAHIHAKNGKIIVKLCAPCGRAAGGAVTISRAVARQLRSGTTYVEIHTARYKKGELRGPVVLGK